MLDHHSRRVLAGTLSRHRTARETCRVLARAPHLELIALDYGDLGAVYGLDTESHRELSADASPLTKARVWLYQRERAYLPIQDRLAELRRHITERTGIEVRPRSA